MNKSSKSHPSHKSYNSHLSQQSQILEGSQAISRLINNIKPAVVAAFPITPQTHIVEDLAKLKADGEADYEYLRAESEFAAASIIEGASATGVRVYSATSSQGLLLMAEVIYNIAGMRLPIVITVANRAVSAPINIWNDHQDAMAVRDAGWIQLFAEDHQEAVEQHLLAYKIAEKFGLPAMVNLDGFVLTHTYDEVIIPDRKKIKKFLPDYKPKKGTYLDPQNPMTFGAFAAPDCYMEIRQQLYDDLANMKSELNIEYNKLKKIIPEAVKKTEKNSKINNALLEYYGPNNPEVILVAMGSMVGTIKDVVDKINNLTPTLSLVRRGGDSSSLPRRRLGGGQIGVLKIKSFRPFPKEEVFNILKTAKYIAVIEKAISLGSSGPLMLEVKNSINNTIFVNKKPPQSPFKKGELKGDFSEIALSKSPFLKGGRGDFSGKIINFIVGLGGRDVTMAMIERIIGEVKKKGDEVRFVGKS